MSERIHRARVCLAAAVRHGERRGSVSRGIRCGEVGVSGRRFQAKPAGTAVGRPPGLGVRSARVRRCEPPLNGGADPTEGGNTHPGFHGAILPARAPGPSALARTGNGITPFSIEGVRAIASMNSCSINELSVYCRAGADAAREIRVPRLQRTVALPERMSALARICRRFRICPGRWNKASGIGSIPRRFVGFRGCASAPIPSPWPSFGA